jgi:hypothetical protein
LEHKKRVKILTRGKDLVKLGILAALLLPCAVGAELRVGAGKRTITPDLEKHGPVYMAGFGQNRKATGIHDDLYARCIAFSTGSRPLVICAVDLIGVFWDDVRKIRAKVDADVVLAALHDHEAPDTMGLWGPSQAQTGINESYIAFLVERTAEAAREAIQSLQPARVRLAKVKTPELDTFIHDTRPPVVHDAEIVALRADGMDGRPIATLINWANHPETLGSRNTLVTADYSGYLYREAERLMEGTAVFVNGAIGGMQSPLGSTVKDAAGRNIPENTFEKAEFIGGRVAKLAAEALGSARPVTLDSFQFWEKLIDVPMTNPGFQMAAKAGIFGGRKQPNADGTTTTPVGYIRFTRGSQAHLEIALVPGELYPELSVGGVARYAGADFPDAPVEPAVKQQMTAPFRMLFGLADDEVGYIIPKAEWDEKAPFLQNAVKAWYGEVNSLGPEAAPRITKALQELMK